MFYIEGNFGPVYLEAFYFSGTALCTGICLSLKIFIQGVEDYFMINVSDERFVVSGCILKMNNLGYNLITVSLQVAEVFLECQTAFAFIVHEPDTIFAGFD